MHVNESSFFKLKKNYILKNSLENLFLHYTSVVSLGLHGMKKIERFLK